MRTGDQTNVPILLLVITAKITIIATNIDTAIHNINITTSDEDPATSSSYELPQPWSPKLYTDRGLESKGWMEFAGVIYVKFVNIEEKN